MSKESILAKQRASQAEIDAILNDRALTFESFREHLRTFVLLKYALEPSDFEQTDNLSELAQISLSRALKVSKDLVADYEAGENCEGATSSDVKRTLLLVKIQKSLSVSLSLEELMQIETLDDVVRLVWPHLSRRTIDQQQDDIVEDFLTIGDPLSQYEYLIEFATALPALDDALKTEEHLVKDCQSQAWLVMENRGGALSLAADSDTLIVRGVLELLIELLDGRPLCDVAAAEIYFPQKAELMTTFSASRRQGIASIIAQIQGFARVECARVAGAGERGTDSRLESVRADCAAGRR